jgi:hypothetical protein|tara:strand:+ start:1096 stop:1548 length:453 start_codon:yes stop_codon:yes gene_type:complete
MPTKLPPNPFMHEVLAEISKARSKDKKIELLKEYRTDALTSLLIWNFDDTIISLLPDGQVPFNKSEAPLGTDHTSLRKEYRNLYHFVKGGNDKLSKTRRESMFIQMLEGLHPDEAAILCLVKDKELSSKFKITKGVVESAYPDIQWGGRS